MMAYKQELRSSWGELFGLDICTLTDEQLSSIKVNKLVEFLDLDCRIENTIVNKLKNISLKEAIRLFSRFKELDKNLSDYPTLYASYNEYVRNKDEDLELESNKNWNIPNREKYLRWEWLDEESRDMELYRYANCMNSIVSETSLDYKWLYDNKRDLAISIAERITCEEGYGSSWSAKVHLITNMPEPMIDRFMVPLFKTKRNKELTFYALSNTNTPHKYIVKALRNIGKRKKAIPEIKVPLSKKVWKDMPSITRLNVMESVVYWAKNTTTLDFGDIKTEEDLKELLFSSFLRYTSRVERLLRVFSKRYCVPQTFSEDKQ